MNLMISQAPHINDNVTVRSIMLDVIIALVPAGIASVWLFGIRSLLVILTCVGFAVASEFVTRKIMKRRNSIGDLSAVLTGLLLAYNLPVTIPLWIAALGSVIAIVVVKQLFGGIGHNFVNPALVARIVLLNSFSKDMSSWTEPFTGSISGVDAVSTATPLNLIANGSHSSLPSYLDMLLGIHGGCIGETCALALIIGGVYLVVRKVISPVIPLCYIGTVAVCALIGGYDVLYQVMSGGLLLGAIFMATDYTTSPFTKKGKIIFAIGCGLITCLIRFFGSLPEGVSYSIVIMNIFVPLINKYTAHKPFGFNAKKAKRGAKQ